MRSSVCFILQQVSRNENHPEHLRKRKRLKADADLQSLMNGAYTDYCNKVYNGKLQWIEDLLGDQAVGTLYTGDDGEIFKRKTSIFGDYKNGMYTDIYRPAYNGNKVLENIDKTGAGRNVIEGQAYFLRALTHFDAVRLWAQPWGYSCRQFARGYSIAHSMQILYPACAAR